MVTRCPGCASEIPEAAEVCPHCKRDFRTLARRGAAKPAEPPPKPPETEKKPAAPPPRKAPDLPRHMIEEAGEPPAPEPLKEEPRREDKPRSEPSLPNTQIIAPPTPAEEVKREEKPKPDSLPPKTMPAEAPKRPEHAPVLLTRCPGCAKQISETADICPHCKRDFRTPEEKAGKPAKPAPQAPEKPRKKDELDLPRHMLAEIEAPARTMDDAESVLPPHMLQPQFEIKRPPEPKGVSSWMFVAVGAAIVVALLAPRFLTKEEPAPQPPPQQPVVVVTPAPQPEPAAAPKPPPAEPEVRAPEPPPVEMPVEKPSKKKKGKKAASPEEPVVIAENMEPPPRAPRAANWILRGRLIDLVTFRPVEGVELTLVDAGSNESFKSTESAADGSFRFKKIPPNSQGYLLTVRHQDYLPKYVLDKDQSYKSMGEDQRKEEARRFVRTTPSNPTLFSRGESEIDQDFIMIPRERHGKSLEEVLQD